MYEPVSQSERFWKPLRLLNAGLKIMRKVFLSVAIVLILGGIVMYVFFPSPQQERGTPPQDAVAPAAGISEDTEGDEIPVVESSAPDGVVPEDQLRKQKYEEALDRFARLYEREKKLGLTPERGEPLEFDLKTQMPPELKHP